MAELKIILEETGGDPSPAGAASSQQNESLKETTLDGGDQGQGSSQDGDSLAGLTEALKERLALEAEVRDDFRKKVRAGTILDDPQPLAPSASPSDDLPEAKDDAASDAEEPAEVDDGSQDIVDAVDKLPAGFADAMMRAAESIVGGLAPPVDPAEAARQRGDVVDAESAETFDEAMLRIADALEGFENAPPVAAGGLLEPGEAPASFGGGSGDDESGIIDADAADDDEEKSGKNAAGILLGIRDKLAGLDEGQVTGFSLIADKFLPLGTRGIFTRGVSIAHKIAQSTAGKTAAGAAETAAAAGAGAKTAGAGAKAAAGGATKAAAGAATGAAGGAAAGGTAAGGAAAAGGGLVAALGGPITIAVGAAVIAVVGLTIIAKKINERLSDLTNQLAPFSGVIAAAQARHEVASILQNIQTARRLEGRMARFIEGQSKISLALERIQRSFDGPLLDAVLPMLDRLATVTELLSRMIENQMRFNEAIGLFKPPLATLVEIGNKLLGIESGEDVRSILAGANYIQEFRELPDLTVMFNGREYGADPSRVPSTRGRVAFAGRGIGPRPGVRIP